MRKLNKVKIKSDLYQEHDYKYYEDLYFKSKANANLGKFIAIFGFAFNVVGVAMYLDNDSSNDYLAPMISIGGFVLFNVGLPVWISNGAKANNNKKAMELSKIQANLSFGTTNNGIGLAFHF